MATARDAGGTAGGHDRACRLFGNNPATCPCRENESIRIDERKYTEQRVRKAGIAHYLPPHIWDRLVRAIREEK